jgi:hypothetical protein
MIYQLPSGRTIEISVEQYLDMSDEEINYLNAHQMGDNIEDPWFGSVLSKQPPKELEEDFIIEDLLDITVEEKLTNPDIDIHLGEEF